MFGLEAKLLAAGGLALALLLGVWFIVHSLEARGAAQCKADVAATVAKSQVEAAAKEGVWNESARELSKARALESQSIDDRHARDLARLRIRAASGPDVPQVAASAASDGSVGGLPDRDRDLLGVGARANKLRAALRDCQAWIAKVRG